MTTSALETAFVATSIIELRPVTPVARRVEDGAAPVTPKSVAVIFRTSGTTGTAKRVPLPEARISTLLYPLVLTAVAALPLTLAVVLAYVMSHAE
jgi:acyl-CoA synthetase (AMP-forming)/AMP-acid ligase II